MIVSLIFKFLLSERMEVEKVIKHLYESLSFKLDIGPQNSLSKEFLSGVAR